MLCSCFSSGTINILLLLDKPHENGDAGVPLVSTVDIEENPSSAAAVKIPTENPLTPPTLPAED